MMWEDNIVITASVPAALWYKFLQAYSEMKKTSGLELKTMSKSELMREALRYATIKCLELKSLDERMKEKLEETEKKEE